MSQAIRLVLPRTKPRNPIARALQRELQALHLHSP